MEEDIKYCVTAFIDLLGFSSHLETGSSDLRTKIGQEAIERLKILEDSLSIIESENEGAKEFYPEVIYKQRINDSLIMMVDLPEFLKPSIGDTYKNSINGIELKKYFDSEDLDKADDIEQVYSKKIDDSCSSLSKFVGVISRMHNYINKKENKLHFPGAKTVIATGYRKVFKNRNGDEDFLAANFSFSNAFVAEQSLHGSKLFIDCNILNLLCNNQYSRNIIKTAIFINEKTPIDPFEECKDYLVQSTVLKESKPITLNLFRKPYSFREVDPKCFAYLQITQEFQNYIVKNPLHINSRSGFNEPFKYLNLINVDKERAKNGFFTFYIDIEENINFTFDLIMFGNSERKDTNNKTVII